MKRVNPALKDAVILDENGAQTRLGELWASKPAVLVFIRHFS